MVQFFSGHEFEILARQYHLRRNFRAFNRWSQGEAAVIIA
ncbi:hypothetical protein KAR10_02735 [bacterium]|nr:hypothetical protein [bacterium]